jgi:hypothetical protein
VDKPEYLARGDIEQKAEEVLLWFAPTQLDEPCLTPLAGIVTRLSQDFGLKVSFNQPLGLSSRGKKILGMCVLRPPAIFVDPTLDPSGPTFRFTLAHELGHLTLHRRLNLAFEDLDKPNSQIQDSRNELYLGRKRQLVTQRDWLEWQANSFASAILMPRGPVRQLIEDNQRALGFTRRLGTIFIDHQWENVRAYKNITAQLQLTFQASRTMVLIRLRTLGLLMDWRTFNVRGIPGLFREE